MMKGDHFIIATVDYENRAFYRSYIRLRIIGIAEDKSRRSPRNEFLPDGCNAGKGRINNQHAGVPVSGKPCGNGSAEGFSIDDNILRVYAPLSDKVLPCRLSIQVSPFFCRVACAHPVTTIINGKVLSPILFQTTTGSRK